MFVECDWNPSVAPSPAALSFVAGNNNNNI